MFRQRICMEVYPEAIRENMKNIMLRITPGTKLCMVVKADAYGHGAGEVAKAVEDITDFFAVAAPSEAMDLRMHGIKEPILLLGPAFPEDYAELIRFDVRLPISRYAEAELLSATALTEGKTARVHIAVNSGMNRIGFAPGPEAAEQILKLAKLPGIEVEGMFTHFAKADDPDLTDAFRQYMTFLNFRTALNAAGLKIPICHCANSAASMVMTDTSLDMVRLGIAAYGVQPSEEMEHPVNLRPAMAIKSHVSLIHDLKEGDSVSYGFTYTAPKPCRLATVPVGYADGYTRTLSNKGEVLIRGKRAPIRGRVCMDQMMVDVSDIPDAAEGDTVTLVGRDGEEEITFRELEQTSGLLSYEIMCGFARKRVPREYK